jgi:hypothetical protein
MGPNEVITDREVVSQGPASQSAPLDQGQSSESSRTVTNSGYNPTPAGQETSRTVVQGYNAAGQQTTRSASRFVSRPRPQGEELIRRIIILAAGLIQLVIGARIVLLLLDAKTTSALVAAVYNVSDVFVAPFNGILQANVVKSASSVLDVSAVLALVGWTILEMVIFWGMNIFRRGQPNIS